MKQALFLFFRTKSMVRKEFMMLVHGVTAWAQAKCPEALSTSLFSISAGAQHATMGKNCLSIIM